MSEYSDLLTDPRWEEKRQEILERDEYTCNRCGMDDIELHVHHKWYRSGIDPWDYPDNCYETLCFECHQSEHGL